MFLYLNSVSFNKPYLLVFHMPNHLNNHLLIKSLKELFSIQNSHIFFQTIKETCTFESNISRTNNQCFSIRFFAPEDIVTCLSELKSSWNIENIWSSSDSNKNVLRSYLLDFPCWFLKLDCMWV